MAEVVRPETVEGQTKIESRFMGIQSIYGHIDSHSQGSIVLDSYGKLHYMPGNHASNDQYFSL